MRTVRPFTVFSFVLSFILIPLLSVIVLYRALPHPLPNVFIHKALQIFRVSKVYHQPLQFPSPPYALFSTRVVVSRVNQPIPVYVLIDEQGKIAATFRAVLQVPWHFLRNIVDVSPFVVMPGLIDPHVHVDSPGKDHWEGFESATRAAAAGGTTTILDMPINSVPATVDESSLALKIASLRAAKASIDVGLIGGVIPSNVENLSSLLNNGVVALKSFLIDSQSPDFPMVTMSHFRTAISYLHNFHKNMSNGKNQHEVVSPIPYILHAELDDGKPSTGTRATAQDTFDHASYIAFEASRPASWETDAVDAVLSVVNGSNVHTHIAHVSTHQVADQIRFAKRNGLGGAQVTAETCGHYIMFSSDNIPLGDTEYKCAPPIRSELNRVNLVGELFTQNSDRVIGLVASDHSPSSPELKESNGNLTSAWGGISGLQYRLGACWHAAKSAGASLASVNLLLSEGPANTFGLSHLKGILASGRDADIVIWDPDVEETVDASRCHHRHKNSAFNGWRLPGQVKFTLLRGHPVFTHLSDGTPLFDEGNGRLLWRNSKGDVDARIL